MNFFIEYTFKFISRSKKFNEAEVLLAVEDNIETTYKTFAILIDNEVKTVKVMMCSVTDLLKEYTGITEVNCYLLIIDLQNNQLKHFQHIRILMF